MKEAIDWKHIASTDGYRKLKRAYMRDAQRAGMEDRPMRNKQELYRHFKEAIRTCMYVANKRGETLEEVLNCLGEVNDYWWLNSWSRHRILSLYDIPCKIPNYPSRRTQLKKTKRRSRRFYLSERESVNRLENPKVTKKKPRLTKEQKEHLVRYKTKGY